MMAAAGGARQGILTLAIKDKAALYSAYMPYLKYGGIFVATPKRYFLGDEVFLLLTLPESSERMPVAAKVVWVTPVGAQGNRPAGIGVQFNESAEGEAVKGKIESLLAGTLNSDRATHTMYRYASRRKKPRIERGFFMTAGRNVRPGRRHLERSAGPDCPNPAAAQSDRHDAPAAA